MNPVTASLLHSLWQAGLLWLALLGALRLLPARASAGRYRLALAAVSLVLVAWFATWSLLDGGGPAAISYEPTAGSSEHALPPPTLAPPVMELGATMSSAPHWQQWLVHAWEIGVLLGFGRIVVSLARSRKLYRETEPVRVPAWLHELDEICRAFGVRAAVELRTCERLLTPVVVGVFRPAIILPARLLLGVPPEMLRAALAHEAAHIARWDPLVNLLQMGVEALLFFNPFVWLINQTVRREREACCDAMAGDYGRDRAGYAEALIWWTRDAPTSPGGALAMSGPGGSLRERVLRLLQPARIPHAASGWRGATGWTLLLALALVTAGLGVRLTVSRLSPRDRVALIARLAAPFRPASWSEQAIPPTETRAFSGTLVDAAGQPVARAEWTIFSEFPGDRSPGTTRADGLTAEDGKFSGSIRKGTLQLRVHSPDFAPIWATFDLGQAAEGVTVKLKRGIDFAVRCVDAEGHAVTGAEVYLGYDTRDGSRARELTDAEGLAHFHHQPEGEAAEVKVVAEGYQQAVAANTLVRASEQAAQITLKKMTPFIVTVLDELNGEPVKGVVLRTSEMWPGGSPWPHWGGNGRKSGDDGRAELPGLNPEVTYGIHAKLNGRGTLFRISPGKESAQTVRLPRERVIRLTVLHLDEYKDQGVLIQFSQMTSENGSEGHSATLQIRDGTGQAVLEGLMPAAVSLHLFGQGTKAPVLTNEVTDFTVDWEKIKGPPKVKVVLRCDAGQKGAPPQGSFWVNWALPEKTGVWEGVSAPIVNGQAEFELPSLALFQLRNASLLGGTIDESIQYQATQDPTRITVPVKPAGLIRVKVIEQDGGLASGMFVHAWNVAKPEQTIEIKGSASVPETPREWHASHPVPLGSAKYSICAWKGLRIVKSEAFNIDADRPARDLVLTLPRAMPLEVLVLDERGAPVPNLQLRAMLKLPANWLGVEKTQTDGAGIATVLLGEGDAHPPLTFTPMSGGYVPEWRPLDFPRARRPQVVVNMGKRLFGRFVDEATGQGIAGIEVFWWVQEKVISSESLHTDASGKFEFTNAPNERVFLMVRYPPGLHLESKDLYVTPGPNEAVIKVSHKP